MPTIQIQCRIDSDTLHIPELGSFIGRDVEIFITERPGAKSISSEQAWKDFFKSGGPVDVDPDLCQEYREFDKQQMDHHS